MPQWFWLLVTAVLGSSLLATLLRNRHERGADVRRRALEAVESFALKAGDWDTAVREAIQARYQHLYDTDSSDPAVAKAKEALREARRELNRLHTLLPPHSRAAELAVSYIGWLALAVDEIDDWPPNFGGPPDPPGLQEDDEETLEDEDYEDEFDESYQEAEMLRNYGLEAWGKFSRAASAELRSGFSPAFKRAVFVTPRRLLKGLLAPIARRRQARQAAAMRERAAEESRAFRERMAKLESSESSREGSVS